MVTEPGSVFCAKIREEQSKLFPLAVAHGVELDADAVRIVNYPYHTADQEAETLDFKTDFQRIAKFPDKHAGNSNGAASQAQIDEGACVPVATVRGSNCS